MCSRALGIACALALALACDAPAVSPPAREHWTYPPPPAAWPLGTMRGRLGRSLAPQVVRRDGIVGKPAQPLERVTAWAVPGEGVARAVLDGTVGDRHAVDLIELDRGHVVWRDDHACIGRVIGVGAQTIVCSDEHTTHALSLADRPTWSLELPAIAMTDDRLVLAGDDGRDGDAGRDVDGADGGGHVVEVVDATTGAALAITKLPVANARVIASCGATAGELFARLPDGKLARIVDGKLAWSVAVGQSVAVGPLVELDGCRDDIVLVTTTNEVGDGSLVALARQSGAVRGRVDGVRGAWPARDGSTRVEIATAYGVVSWPRDLTGDAHALALPAFGKLVATRADRRLVRANPLAAVLLDRDGVVAYLPLTESTAVLGADHVLAPGWGAAWEPPRRFALPARLGEALRDALDPTTRVEGLGLPAELRDLPSAVPLNATRAIATTQPGSNDDLDVAIDPDDANAIYVATRGVVARFELGAQTLQWSRELPCRGDLVVAHDLAACAATSGVLALDKTGAQRWTFAAVGVDTLAAAGDVVLAFIGTRLEVIDARDGHALGAIVSDDGAPVRAAATTLGDATVVLAYERGRLVARLPRAAMVPVWSLAVDGIVRDVSAAGDGVIVALADGDAYRVEARDGRVTALSSLGLAWHGGRDVIVGETRGEPTPPARMPVEPPPVIAKHAPKYEQLEAPPPIAIPWQVGERGARAWQLVIYDPTGGLRARADYAFGLARLATARAPSAPLVVLDEVERTATVLDRVGAPLRRVAMPTEIGPHALFSTIVDGKPVVGVVLAHPLRVVSF